MNEIQWSVVFYDGAQQNLNLLEGFPGAYAHTIIDDAGNVVGLMPHPEDHVLGWQRPSGPEGGSGLPLFEAFVAAAR